VHANQEHGEDTAAAKMLCADMVVELLGHHADPKILEMVLLNNSWASSPANSFTRMEHLGFLFLF
jgi:hypothetical protein